MSRDADRRRLATAEGLAHVMGNTCCLALATMSVSWNLHGPGAAALRRLLGEQHGELMLALEALADRTRALGIPAVADESDGIFAQERRIALCFAPRDEALRALAGAHGGLIESIEAAIGVARDGEDEATQALLCARLASHDRHRVMLSSELE